MAMNGDNRRRTRNGEIRLAVLYVGLFEDLREDRAEIPGSRQSKHLGILHNRLGERANPYVVAGATEYLSTIRRFYGRGKRQSVDCYCPIPRQIGKAHWIRGLTSTRRSPPSGGTRRVARVREQVLRPPGERERMLRAPNQQLEGKRAKGGAPKMIAFGFLDIVSSGGRTEIGSEGGERGAGGGGGWQRRGWAC